MPQQQLSAVVPNLIVFGVERAEGIHVLDFCGQVNMQWVQQTAPVVPE